jgi:hypothetical protein
MGRVLDEIIIAKVDDVSDIKAKLLHVAGSQDCCSY